MLRGLLLLLSLSTGLNIACSKTIDDHRSELDFGNPKRVVSSVFFAAETGEDRYLKTLCDPLGKANHHAKRICSQQKGQPDWAAFVKQFAKGRLTGEARVAGDRALVNFAFGPGGTDPETMELVKRNGRWHLLAF